MFFSYGINVILWDCLCSCFEDICQVNAEVTHPNQDFHIQQVGVGQSGSFYI